MFGSIPGVLRLRSSGARAVPATPILTPTSQTLTTSRSGFYNTGITEQAVEQKAIEDGQAGTLDPATIGTNSHPHAVDALVNGHDAATGVIGFDTRASVQEIDAALEGELLNFKSTEAAALTANGNYEAAERSRILQGRRMKATGLPTPSKDDTRKLIVSIGGLFLGDWGLITLGYQVLGLSDRPWISFIGFTDDLHLAAFSSVFALALLGEVVGSRLRRIEYALENRRQADEEEREKLPKPAAFDFFWLTVCLAGALTGVGALSHIRAEYLKAMGANAGGGAFFGIQLVILLAAVAIGFAHANPEAKQWKGVDGKAARAEVERSAAVAVHVSVGSRINAAIDRRLALMAQAGQHVETDAANVRLQTAVYKRRYLLSQLEPAQDQVFGEHLLPIDYKDDELLKRITGVNAFPAFLKVDAATVMNALEKTRITLDTLRARIDQVEINRLNLPPIGDVELKAMAAESGSIDHTAPSAPSITIRSTPPASSDTTRLNGSKSAQERA